MGRRPGARQILSLWTQRATSDCITQLGRHDPVRGGTVVASFDTGPHRPVVVWCQQGPRGQGVNEVPGCSGYSLLDFDE